DAGGDTRRDVDPLPGPPHPYTDAIAPRRDDDIRAQPGIPRPVLPCLDAMLRDDVLPCWAPNSHVLFLHHISRRWCRPRHIPRRAGLLRHVAQGLPVGGPLLACRARRTWSVGKHDPVRVGQPTIALGAKRGPRLGLAFLLDLLFGAPCDLHVRHYSITSGSGNASCGVGFGPWNLSSVTSSCPFTRRAASTGQMSSVVSRADTSSSPSGRPEKSKVSVLPSRVAVMVSPENW